MNNPIFKCLTDGQTQLADGLLHDRVSKNEHILFSRIDPDGLAHVYTEEHDRGYAEPEFCGKYIDTAVSLWRSTGRSEYLARAKKIVDSIKANQRSDGYLGTYRKGMEFAAFGIWNAQFTIRGLLAYSLATDDQEALACACRGADFIVTEFTKEGGPDLLTSGNQNIQHSCLLPDMVRLYRATGNASYRSFCQYIIDRWESSEGLRLVSRSADCLGLACTKAAEMLICYQGLVEFYLATDEARYLKAAEAYWESVYVSQIGPSGNGSVKEYWQPHPGDLLLDHEQNPNENCVAVCWMKLTMLLLECTGNARYADAFEQTLYNHLLGSQAADGSDFSYYQPLEGAKIHVTHPKQYSCCRYRGMNMLAQLNRYVFLEATDGPVVNIYTMCTSTLNVHGQQVTLSQSTNYPLDGRVMLTVHPTMDVRFTLYLRKPNHCSAFKIAVDGRSVAPADDVKGFVKIDQLWSQRPHTVEIFMELKPHSKRELVKTRDCLAIFHGPVLLAIDSHSQDRIDACTINFENSAIQLADVRKPDSLRIITCSATGSVDNRYAQITLVDYASAGSRDTGRDRFKVWIPVSQ